MAKKRRKRNYTNWGQTRRIDGEIYDCYDYNCSKATAERAAKQARAKGYKARVLKGRSNYDYAVYVKQIHLTEHELNVGETIRSSRAGRFRGASVASNLK